MASSSKTRSARLREEIQRQMRESIALGKHLEEKPEILLEIAEVIVRALEAGGKVVLFGNGGSAADALHFAAELSGRFGRDRDPLAAIALVDNPCVVTAIANDYGYDEVFARQVRAIVQEGDVAIGMSTSGTSPNIIAGIQEAKRRGAVTVGFMGEGGALRGIVDHALTLPSKHTPRIQEAHAKASHVICYLVEESLFGEEAA